MIIDHMKFLGQILSTETISKEKKLKEIEIVEDLLNKALELIKVWKERINEENEKETEEKS